MQKSDQNNLLIVTINIILIIENSNDKNYKTYKYILYKHRLFKAIIKEHLLRETCKSYLNLLT